MLNCSSDKSSNSDLSALPFFPLRLRGWPLAFDLLWVDRPAFFFEGRRLAKSVYL